MRHLFVLVLTAGLLLAGCPPPSPDRPLPEGPARRVASSAEAQRAFDHAVVLAQAGRWAEAEQAFQLFTAEFPADPLAVRAELYVARCRIALGRRREARSMLDDLARRPDDRSTRDAALAYLGFLDGLEASTPSRDRPVDRLLDEAPDTTRLLDAVLLGDEALVLSLVAEARIRRGDAADAIVDLEAVAIHAEDPSLLLYAWDRATELAERALPLEALSRLHARGGLFLVAVTTAPLVRRLVERGDPDAARRALAVGADAMEQAGLTDRLLAARALVDASSPHDGALPCYGVLLSLSGPDRRAGRAALGSVLLAERAFESASPAVIAWIHDVEGSAHRVRLALEDVRARGCAAAIGPLEPALDATGRSVATEFGIPWVSLSSTALPAGTEGAVRVQASAGQEAHTVVAWTTAREPALRIAIIEDHGPNAASWLTEFAAELEAAATAHGAEIVARLGMDVRPEAAQTSAERVAREVARSGANAVGLAIPSEAASAVAAWLARSDLWPRAPGAAGPPGRRSVVYLGTGFLPSDTLLRDAATSLEHAVIPAWFFPETAQRRASDFRFRFEAVHGRVPGSLEAFAFDAASLVHHVILTHGATTPARFRERIAAGLEVPGVTGTLRFDANGNPAWTPALITIRSGRHVALEP